MAWEGRSKPAVFCSTASAGAPARLPQARLPARMSPHQGRIGEDGIASLDDSHISVNKALLGDATAKCAGAAAMRRCSWPVRRYSCRWANVAALLGDATAECASCSCPTWRCHWRKRRCSHAPMQLPSLAMQLPLGQFSCPTRRCNWRRYRCSRQAPVQLASQAMQLPKGQRGCPIRRCDCQMCRGSRHAPMQLASQALQLPMG